VDNQINISHDQMQAFGDQQSRRFENEMVAHLRKEYAYKLACKEEDWVRELVQIGILESSSHGFELEKDVARYIELMVVLSPDFDSNKKFKFAGEALSLEGVSPEQRLDIIYEHMDREKRISPSSHPYGIVGSPVVNRSHEPTGSLLLHLDAESASIQIKGSKNATGVSDSEGVFKFSDLPLGEYKVFAIDSLYRMFTGKVIIERGVTELQLSVTSRGIL